MDLIQIDVKPSNCCSKEQQCIIPTTPNLTLTDKIGTWKARWGINRMNYKVEPGLYAIGTPKSSSPVMVTANYKMSFDMLRKELSGVNAYILVLDTKGINVWCAAGKGTFGTKELVYRMMQVGLDKVVTHKTIILPQLGAVGVSAHEVKKTTGFKVIYGPVRARDLKEFLNQGMTATTEMRKVEFPFLDRLVLTPMELVPMVKPSLMVFGVMFLLNLLGLSRFDGRDVIGVIGALLAGCFFVPALLPWIPGRAFAFKGWVLGVLWTMAIILSPVKSIQAGSTMYIDLAYLLIFPAISAYCGMNFTGASTYTSFSGVVKEMKIAVPAVIISIGLGLILMAAGRFILT